MATGGSDACHTGITKSELMTNHSNLHEDFQNQNILSTCKTVVKIP